MLSFDARVSPLQVMLNAGKGFVNVEQVTGDNGEPDLLLTLDRSKIESVGKPAIGEFLKKIQIYKISSWTFCARVRS